MNTNEPAISIQGVTKRYPVIKREEGSLLKKCKKEVKALDNVSLDVKRGEIVGILGPNGAGKTTLIKVMAGVLFQEEGKARVNGFDTIKERQKVRTSINLLRSGGWVIFDYKLSLFTNLQFWGVFHEGLRIKEAQEKIPKVLKTVGLLDKMHDFPENLSSGMRQKLCLALTLLSDRPVYLMDEPMANIDPYTSNYLRKFIREELADKGKSIVLATHNLWEAEELCDRIVILKEGRVLEFTTSEELRAKIGKEVLKLEVEAITPNLLEELEAFPFVDSVREDDGKEKNGKGRKMPGKDAEKMKAGEKEGNGAIISIFGNVKANVPNIISAVSKHTTIHKTETTDSSLNDVFMQMMEEKEEDA